MRNSEHPPKPRLSSDAAFRLGAGLMLFGLILIAAAIVLAIAILTGAVPA